MTEHTSFHVESSGVPGRFVVVAVISLICGTLFGLLGGVAGSLYIVPALDNETRPAVSFWNPGDDSTIQVTEDSATVDVVEASSDSVVNIVVTKELSRSRSQFDSPFDRFFGFPGFPTTPREGAMEDRETYKQEIGGGSGFIVTEDGMILTNRHVVSDESAEYTVVMRDGAEYEATVLAKDPVNDIAILQIEAEGLVALPLGDSDAIQIGQTVIAIGNSLGEFSNTVTRGVISGIDRVIEATDGLGQVDTIYEALQTDAAINPGNSGGPLLNLAGQVIGINTAVSLEGQSIGFAIPINVARRSLESVQQHGRILRPWLGVRYAHVDAEYVEQNSLPYEYGAVIIGNPEAKQLGVVVGSPADKAGLKDGDIILEVQGQRIDFDHTLVHEIAKYNPGETVTLKLYSDGGEKEVSVTLGEFDESQL